MSDEFSRRPTGAPTSNQTPSESELASRSAGEDGKVTKLQTNKARQGLLGMPVLLVLVAALVLVALAWWGAEIYGEAIAPEDPVGGAAESAADQ